MTSTPPARDPLVAAETRWLVGMWMMYTPAFFLALLIATAISFAAPRGPRGAPRPQPSPFQAAMMSVSLMGATASTPLLLVGLATRTLASRQIRKLVQNAAMNLEPLRTHERLGIWVVSRATESVLVLETNVMPFGTVHVARKMLIGAMIGIAAVSIGGRRGGFLFGLLFGVYMIAIMAAAIRFLADKRVTIDLGAEPPKVTVTTWWFWPFPGRTVTILAEHVIAVREDAGSVRLTAIAGRDLTLGVRGHDSMAPRHAARLAAELRRRLAIPELASPLVKWADEEDEFDDE